MLCVKKLIVLPVILIFKFGSDLLFHLIRFNYIVASVYMFPVYAKCEGLVWVPVSFLHPLGLLACFAGLA